MKKKVTLKPLQHRGKELLAINFDYDKVLQQKVKLGGASWSQSNKAWYTALNRVNFEKIKKALDGQASMDYSTLKIYLEQKKVAGSKKSVVPLPVRLKKQGDGCNRAHQKKVDYTTKKIHIINAYVTPKIFHPNFS